MASFLDRLGERWDARAGAQRPARRSLTGGAAGPATSVTVERMVEVAVDPGEVWAIVSSPLLLTIHETRGNAFVLPGSAPERWCRVGRAVEGAMLGSLTEVLEREEGSRIRLRWCSTRPFPVWEWRVAASGEPGAGSLVSVSVTLELGERLVDAGERALAAYLEREVTWLLHRLTGAAPPPSAASRDEGAVDAAAAATQRHATRPLETREVEADVVVPLPPGQVWDGVLDATTFSLDAADGEWAGVVPGTPAGRVGELRCVVSAAGDLPVVRFHEVVQVGGRQLTLRQHSSSHAWHLVTTVEPHPDGSLVHAVGRVAVHPEGASVQLGAVRNAVAAHLDRFSAEVQRRAALGPGC